MTTGNTRLVGIDLSGPSNHTDTALAVGRLVDDRLDIIDVREGMSDCAILTALSRLESDDLVVALDAPLSYQDGGGDRDRDRDLRQLLTAKGMKSGSVMTPTMTRMAYLTLRGISLSRMIAGAFPNARIMEVHPLGSLALAGAPVDALTTVKQSATARETVARWLIEQGRVDHGADAPSDHVLAALASARAAWIWSNGNTAWDVPAAPPHHPFAFVC